MLSQNYKDFLSLPKGAKIGTTSLRRKMQLLLLRPDLEIISLRGNVNSRIEKLKIMILMRLFWQWRELNA